MKNILIALVLLVCISFAQAQDLKNLKIDTYNGSTHSYASYSTYTNSTTDTTEFVKFGEADSIHFYISSNDSARVFVKVMYGDGEYSNALVSATTDSLVTTSTGWKSISWAKLVSSCGNEIAGCKLQLAFQSAGNAASSESAKYRVYYKKFYRK